MISLRLAGFFQRFLKYVFLAFSVPGFRSGVEMIKDTLFDGLLSIRIVKNPLNLDRRKLGADIKGFNIGIDGFFAFPSSWINKGFPG